MGQGRELGENPTRIPPLPVPRLTSLPGRKPLLPPSCVALDKAFNFSGPQCPHSSSGESNSPFSHRALSRLQGMVCQTPKAYQVFKKRGGEVGAAGSIMKKMMIPSASHSARMSLEPITKPFLISVTVPQPEKNPKLGV